MDIKSFTLQFSADNDGLQNLYEFLSDVAIYLDLDDKVKFEIELAIEEAVSNIIHHAYQDQGGNVAIEVAADKTEITVILQDWGRSFNLDTVPEFDYSEPVQKRINGGMGIHFMRTLMDSVKLESSETYGNVLTMTKKYEARVVQNVDELQVFEQVSRALSSVHAVDDLLELIVRRLTQVVEADRGTLYLVDQKRDEIYSKILQQGQENLTEIRLKIGEGLAGYVAKTGETINIRSAKDDPRFASRIDAQSGYITRNMICAPMINATNKIVGVVQLINKSQGHFTRRDETILRALASQAAIALENARLIESEKNRRQLADTLREVAAIINSSLELDTVLSLILEQLERVIPFQNSSILLIEDDFLVVRASRGVNSEQILWEPLFKVEDSQIFQDIVSTDQPLIVADTQEDSRWIHLETTSRLHGFIGAVLKTGENIIGELAVIHNEIDFYTPEHASILATFANQASSAIERAKLYEQSIQQARLKQELETAYRIQTSFLPEHVPELDAWQIAASWQPAQEVSGDFYDFIQLPDGRLGFVIADVSGKGVPAALFMALARTIFRTLVEDDLPLDQLLARANDNMLNENRARFFVTLFYGVLDPQSGEFRYVNAGHNPPVFVHMCNKNIEFLKTSGPAVGVFGGVAYTEEVMQFDPHDVLVLYTDGITEAINSDEEEFEERRLVEVIRDNCGESAVRITAAIGREIQNFVGNLPQHDDSTVIVIKRTDE